MANILLTGSSSGFGRVSAQLLAKQGHHVFATMRSLDTKNRLVSQYLIDWAQANNLLITVIELDVASQQSADRALEEIAHYTDGRIEVLINNAGVGYIGLNETLSPAQLGIYLKSMS